MKKTILISISIFICFQMLAEKLPYTIMAPSGVFLRESPSIDSKKIGSVLFGEVVYQKADDGYSETHSDYHNFYQITLKDTLAIEGNRGHWVPVEYLNLKGYVFSGFILPGEWIIKGKDGINEEYQLLQSGSQDSPVSYNPRLHWYVLDSNDEGFAFKQVDVSLTTMHQYTEEEQDMAYLGYPFKIMVNGKDTSTCWLIGTNNPIEKTSRQLHFYSFENIARFTFERGLYLFPTQSLIRYDRYGGELAFHAEEKIIIDKSVEGGFRREYKLKYKETLGRELFKEYDLSKDLNLEGTAQEQKDFNTPLLVWVGDVNGDLQPDYIFYSGPARESHEGTLVYALYLSDQHSPGGIRLVSKCEFWIIDHC